MAICGCGILLERELQGKLAKQAYGDVLVAGYGFGLIVEALLKNPRVKSITSVEKCREVLDAVGKTYGKVILWDFYDSPEDKKYDCVIGDIWQDIDPLFLKDYKKFKAKASKLLKKDGKILAWGQDFFEYLLKLKYDKKTKLR